MSSDGLVWARLHLPVPLHPEAADSAVRILAGLAGSPLVVLEAIGCGGAVSWRLGAARDHIGRVVAAMRPHLGELRVDKPEPNDASVLPDVAVSLRIRGHRKTSLGIGRREPVARGVLAALAATHLTESLRVQLLLGPRYAPRRVPHQSQAEGGMAVAERRDLTVKLAQARFGCVVRVAASGSGRRPRALVGNVLSALRGLEVPGAGLSLRRSSGRAVATAGVPFVWPLELTVSEVTALLGWPLASKDTAALPGVPARHPRLLPVAPAIPSAGRVLGASALASARPVALGASDSLRHLHILGPNGVGKSTLMANLALQDIAAGHSVMVVDPKGDLIADLLARIPEERLDDVVVLDPSDAAPVGVDAFAGNPDLAADVLLGVFHSLYESAWGPRTSDILHASLLSLARRAALDEAGDAARPTLTMLPLLLTHPGFRRSVTGRVVKADPLGLGTFWATFENWTDAERSQAIQPLMNKLRQVLLRPGLRAVFGQRHPRFAFSDVLTKRRILLINLSEGLLGPEASQLLGSLAVGLFWQAALGRTQVPEQQRRPVFVHIDEMQRYVRIGDVGDALARARGLGVGFTLAHQHLGQLTPSLREAVMANARSKVAFQLSPGDAKTYAATSSGQLEAADFQALPAFQAYVQLLAGNQASPWCSLATAPLPPIASRTRAAMARKRSRQCYGRPLDVIESELAELVAGVGSGTAAADVEQLGRRRPAARAGGAQ